MHIYIYTYVYTYILILYILILVLYIYIFIYLCMYILIYIYIYTHITYTYTYTFTFTYIHTDIYIYILKMIYYHERSSSVFWCQGQLFRPQELVASQPTPVTTWVPQTCHLVRIAAMVLGKVPCWVRLVKKTISCAQCWYIYHISHKSLISALLLSLFSIICHMLCYF